MSPKTNNQTPAESDYTIGSLTKAADSDAPVTVTAKDGKSSGTITIYYEGIEGTTYTKSKTVPIAAGKYAVTFDVAAAPGWKAATGLVAGTLTITADNNDDDDGDDGEDPVDTPITSAALSVTAPVKNASPVNATAEAGVNFTVTSTSWNPNDTSFAGGTVYAVTVVMTANEGYTFTGLAAATINGQAATVSANSDSTATVSYTFGITDSRTLTSMTVKTQPTLTYTHGDALDLSGIVVTLTYDSGSPEDVAFAGFAAKNITVSLVNGAVLNRSIHNNQPVTIIGGGKEAPTGNITVNTKDITSAMIDSIPAVQFNNSEHKPELTITHGDYTLEEEEDYEVEYADNHDAGIATVTITGMGNYSGETDVNFTINPQPITEADINITAPVKGETPDTVGETESTHFYIETITWEPADNPFKVSIVYTATVTLKLKSDNYTFAGLSTVHLNTSDPEANVATDGKTLTATHPFSATLKDVSGITVKTQPTKLVYTYGEHFDLAGLVVTLDYDDTTTDDVAFVQFDTYNITTIPADGDKAQINDSGKPIVVHYGANHTDDTSNVTVNAKDIDDNSITVVSIPAVSYNGTAHEPDVVVKDGAEELDEVEDYTVSYSNNTNAGQATVTITGTGNYTSMKTANFTISPRVTTLTVEPIEAVNYTGSVHEPTVTVKDGATELTLTADYTVSYSNNTNAGQATVTITGAGNYAGSSGTGHFTIYPTYTVTFDSNGGSSIAPITDVNHGTTVTKPDDPSRARYTFDNWYTQNGNLFNFATTITDDITLRAEWNYSGGTPIVNVIDIVPYLVTQTTGTSVDNPVNLPVQIDLETMTLADSGWQNLLGALGTAGKYVNLDLSACTMTGTEFDPVYNVTTGKDKIVSIALPDVATSTADGPSGITSFRYFNNLTSFSGAGLISIGSAAFGGSLFTCTSLALTELPEGITSIGYSAFQGCTNLALISLPEGLTSIDADTFRNCTKLALTSLPEDITSIGNRAFYGCTSLTLTELPESLISIGSEAFNGCTNLALTELPEGLTSIGYGAFQGCTNLALISLPEGITSIDGQAFQNCTNLALTSLPESITTIGNSAFNGCTSLALISLPEDITYIDMYAFQNCTSLALTSLPESITTIGNSAFNGCTNLALTSLPEGLTSINTSTFSGCTSLVQITLPESLISIGMMAFSACTNLATVTCLAETPPSMGMLVFMSSPSDINPPSNLAIKVPAGSVAAYKAAPNWSGYASRISAIGE